MIIPNIWNNKNVPNHQPDEIFPGQSRVVGENFRKGAHKHIPLYLIIIPHYIHDIDVFLITSHDISHDFPFLSYTIQRQSHQTNMPMMVIEGEAPGDKLVYNLLKYSYIPHQPWNPPNYVHQLGGVVDGLYWL